MASPGRQILAEIIRTSIGVTGRSVTTPGVRDKLTDIEGEVPIDKEVSDRYRANTMRAHYVSSDRPDAQIECRDLARKMQQPSNLDEMGLNRLARFLGVRPRLVWMFRWENRRTRIGSWCACCALRQHVLQRTSRDCTQFRRSGVLWVGDCDIENAWPAEHSP